MADAAAAGAAVTFLLQRLEEVVRRELSLEGRIKAEISSLRLELEMIQASLKEADASGYQDHRFVVWIQQVQGLAYAIENVFDTFAFNFAQYQLKWYHSSRRLANHSIANLLEEIKSKIISVKDIRERYHIINSSQGSSTTNYTYYPPRMAHLNLQDSEIVGMEESLDMLTSWARQRGPYRVLFVTGMGGSGKTTLVKKVYDNLKRNFDCHAWITLSRTANNLEFLCAMLNALHNPVTEPTTGASISSCSYVDLVTELQNYLQGKRYFIVLDDLWIRDVWESVKYALPKSSRSRIIITSRRGDIAYLCKDDSVDLHSIQPLSQEKARELFYKKASLQRGRSSQGIEWWCGAILRKCEGLPIGIIEIARLLSCRQKTESECKKLHDSLGSELQPNGRLASIRRVLYLSYDDLPYHLKYCFLYMSIFPEEYLVKRRRLIRLWIAEGFIKEEMGKELEDTGEDYLKELVERNLIQVSTLDFDKKPRTCRVNCLMYKIILDKSQDENFCSVFRGQQHPLIGNSGAPRRISIQSNNCDISGQNLSHTRTLLTFGFENPTYICKLKSTSLKLLKILHLEGANLEKFPSEIEELLLLTYLCLSNTKITSIPKSIGKFRRLVTLDLKQTLVTKLPKEIGELDNLRHLLVHHYNVGSFVAFDSVKGFEMPGELDRLTNLQALSFVSPNRHHGVIPVLQSLTKLRKLGIVDLPQRYGRDLCHTFQRLHSLHSLNVTSLQQEEILDIQEVAHPPRLLQRLYLKGRLERMPNWISRLNDLARIRLKWSRLSYSNPIEILQDLPNLLELQLLDAYTGQQLNFLAGKFQKLKILDLEKLEQLTVIRMDINTLPGLQKLIIKQCSRLRNIPGGIQGLSHLKELLLYDIPHCVTQLEKNRGQQRHLVRHIPKIFAFHYRPSNDEWVPEDLS